jgi:hypothetical protein
LEQDAVARRGQRHSGGANGFKGAGRYEDVIRMETRVKSGNGGANVVTAATGLVAK